MIEARTFEFLKSVQKNPSKDWIDEHRKDYDATKANLADAASVLIGKADMYDSKIGGAHLDPKKCVSRLNRDMRFAKNKPAYKHDFFIMLNPGKTSQSTAAYYVHVESGNCYAGGGAFTPQPDDLNKIRDEIVASTSEWKKIVEAPKLKELFPDGITTPETLKQGPQGYDPEHEAAKYLKMKGFCVNHPITDKLMQSDDALEEIIKAFKGSKGLVEFINAATLR